MTTEVMQPTLAIWATRGLPGRLDVAQTAKLLGFGAHDLQILMAVGKLTPLGDPAPNAPKWFAAIEMIRLATDEDWLHKATKELAKYWRNKRERRCVSSSSPRSAARRKVEIRVEKVSPNSSPESSPSDQLGGVN
jgi:hypothetical protein